MVMAPNQWAIREVAEATFYDKKTKKAIVQLTNLKSSGIENTAETVYARGGRGNGRIVGFSGTRDGNITLQDAVFTNEVIAMMSGSEVATGAVPVKFRDEVTVVDGTATLKYTPAVDGINSAYILNEDNTHDEELEYITTGVPTATEFAVADKTVTFAADAIPDGTVVVVYYTTLTGATAKQIVISADKFAGTYELVLDCLVRDTILKEDFAAQIHIPDAKMEDNWTITMAPDGDPSTFDIPVMIMKPARGNDMYTMTIYDEADMV